MPFIRRHLMFALAAVTAVSCRQNTDRVPEHDSSGLALADTAGLPARTTPPRDSLGGTLAERIEPQQHFDQARAAFASSDRASTAAALRQAAAHFRQVTDTASPQVRAQLNDVERSLSALAGKMEGTASVSLREIDRVFASAHLAEAERHQVLSVNAWTEKDSLRTAEELVMAVDHLERAAKDARLAFDAKAKRELASARKTGAALLAHTALDNGVSVPRTQQDIGTLIGDVRARSSR